MKHVRRLLLFLNYPVNPVHPCEFTLTSTERLDVADGDGEFAVVAVVRVVGAGLPGTVGAEFEFVGAGGGEFFGDFEGEFEPAVAEEREGAEREAVEGEFEAERALEQIG